VRIALTHAFCWPEVRRGGERLVAELARALTQLGHDVTMLSSAFAPGRSTVDSVREVRYRRWRKEVFAAEADFGVRVLPELAAGRFDVVHSHGRRDGVASIRAASLHRRRATVHTDIGIPSREWWSTLGREFEYAARVIRDIGTYACLSEHALGVLAADWGRMGVVIPGGVDLAQFQPASERTPTPTILFSGAIDEPRKGVATLLAALPIIAREEPEVRLLLSGPGDASALLAAAPKGARERTDLLGTGALEDQPGRYGRAWVCALPSLNDTFGLALVEALACGTPIVAADSAALPELVTEGETGALCRVGDPDSAARACLQAIALSRRAETADACRESARRFDWLTAVAPRSVEVYEQTLARRR
jgi:phosphatidylinositol alpha-mannosyltransferase